MNSDPALRRLYRKYNRELFGEELPDSIPVWYEPTANAAETIVIDGNESPPLLGIRFDTCMLGLKRYRKLVLVHEMVHVKQWQYKRLAMHGAKFDEEIQRLCTFKSYRKLL